MTDALEIVLIVLVDMAVHHVARTVLFHHIQKGFEPGVRQIGVVAEAARGGMGHQDINAAAAPDFEAELLNALAHLLFGILVHAAVIAHRAAEAENAQAADGHDLILDAQAPFRRVLGVLVVVVAADIEDGRGGEAGEEGEIAGGQIAAGQHQLHAFELAPVQMLPERRFRLIGEQKNLHRFTPLWRHGCLAAKPAPWRRRSARPPRESGR